MFAGEKIKRRTPLYWHFNYAQGPSKVAMRDGDWKIMATLTGPILPPTGHVKEADQVAIKSAQLAEFQKLAPAVHTDFLKKVPAAKPLYKLIQDGKASFKK